MTLIINNAADSRKLSEANDPLRHIKDECHKQISTAIDHAVAIGAYQASVDIPSYLTREVVYLLHEQGYAVLTAPSSQNEKNTLQISW